MEARTITPAFPPVTCMCIVTHRRVEQQANHVFQCQDCGGYLGYCGPNGCDAYIPHEHWREHGNPTAMA